MNSNPISPLDVDPETLLRRIGWHPSDWAQIEACARMTPAQKIETMLNMRAEAVRLLKDRLKREHPDLDRVQLEMLVQEHLDIVRERFTDG